MATTLNDAGTTTFWFWNEHFWLPENVTWADLRSHNGMNYPQVPTFAFPKKFQIFLFLFFANFGFKIFLNLFFRVIFIPFIFKFQICPYQVGELGYSLLAALIITFVRIFTEAFVFVPIGYYSGWMDRKKVRIFETIPNFLLSLF